VKKLERQSVDGFFKKMSAHNVGLEDLSDIEPEPLSEFCLGESQSQQLSSQQRANHSSSNRFGSSNHRTDL
jgi:hypothetical protein